MSDAAPGTPAPQGATIRLATYGTLAPGRSNHHQLAGLAGRWLGGTVRGRRYDRGWGSNRGFPGLVPDPAGHPVEVFVFESPDLPAHWARLDAFEGETYARVAITVETAEGPLAAYIYAVTL